MSEYTALPFLIAQTEQSLYILKMSQRKEEGGLYALRLESFSGFVRVCAGMRYPDFRNFSGRCTPVSCGVFADWLRLCLPAQVGREDSMKIVVVKSPKFLKGILRMLFGIRE